METPFFSVIVPIYKVEKYIGQCVQSVLEQTELDFELILVDDGSPDRCGEICEGYKKQDDRIKVIHKKNGGLSSARNAGLDIASGKYIIFLDSDDFWNDRDALKNICNNLFETNADVLVFPAKRYYEGTGKVTFILSDEVSRNQIIDVKVEKAIQYMLERNIFRAAAWNKVIRKNLIDEHHMRFKEGVLSEDMDWCGDLLLYSARFDFYGNPFYSYRQQRAGSITSGKTEKLVADKIYMCWKGYKQAKEYPDKTRGRLLACYYAYEYAVTLGVSSGVKNKMVLQSMEELQPLLQYDLCNKVKKVNRLRKIAGYTLTRKALCFFVKIKK